jgi:hypothetical protein
MADVLTLLREHSDDDKYHPLCALLDLADQPDATIGDQIMIHKTIARYVEAERKAIELDISNEKPVNFKFMIN